MFAIVKSPTSKVSKQYYGHTFEVKELSPIHIIMNINGQESILPFHDALIIDIENEYHDAKNDWEEKKNRKVDEGAKSIMIRVIALAEKKFLNLQAYCRANQIQINEPATND